MRLAPSPGATLIPAFLPAAVGVVGFITFILLLLLGPEGAMMGALGRGLPWIPRPARVSAWPPWGCWP